MQILCIGVKQRADEIVDGINNELRHFDKETVNYSIDEVETGESTSIICRFHDDQDFKAGSLQCNEELRLHISYALADHIIRQYEEKLLSRIINSNYCYFTNGEKKEILQFALRSIHNEEKNFLKELYGKRRRNLIVHKLMEYLESSSSIILDGFVNFRLKDYVKDLEELVDKAVDDFLMDREYKEFIRLLRYFVDIQNSSFKVIHIIRGYEDKYLLLDEDRKEITSEAVLDFISDMPEGEISNDDMLVSTLITLAPKRIIIHGGDGFKNKELLATIKNVFFGKVTLCGGCEICTMNLVKG